MNLLQKVLATARFDFARSFRPSRLAVLFVLVLFPPVITAISAVEDGMEFAPAILGVTLMMVGVLALLLWATPIVHQELESKTWAYVSVRPEGKIALLLGKYLMSVLWTVATCTISLFMCVAIIAVSNPNEDVFRIWLVFFSLICMAAMGYGAMFLLFGVMFPRRSMVFAVGYMFFVEGIVATVPALINQLTIRHHLTALAIRWLNFDFASDEFAQQIAGMGEPTWQNITILLISPLILLSVTIYLIVTKEFITADEN